MEGDLQRALGRNLRAHRQKLGLSQEQFAEKLGYHRTYIGGIEQGLRNLSLRSVERLAEDLDIDTSEMLFDRPDPSGNREQEPGGGRAF